MWLPDAGLAVSPRRSSQGAQEASSRAFLHTRGRPFLPLPGALLHHVVTCKAEAARSWPWGGFLQKHFNNMHNGFCSLVSGYVANGEWLRGVAMVSSFLLCRCFTVLGTSAARRLGVATGHSRLHSLKRSSVSLSLSFTEDLLLGAHVPKHSPGSFMEWDKVRLCIHVKTEPSGGVKNSGSLHLERDDVVKTNRILLINKGRLLANS